LPAPRALQCCDMDSKLPQVLLNEVIGVEPFEVSIDYPQVNDERITM